MRVRRSGQIVCAASHPELPGDTYLHDGLHYLLSVELRVLVTERVEQKEGRRGHAKHGEWWWSHDVPADVVTDPFYGPVRSGGGVRA